MWQKVARREPERSEREKGGDHAPGDSKGRSPWRAFGDFPRVGKVTRGGGAERPHKGRSAEDGAQPLLASGQQGPKAPAKGPASPRGRGDTLRSPRIGMLKKFL